MKHKPLPTFEQVHELLTYYPDTGKLFWKPRPLSMFLNKRTFLSWQSRFAHQPAFTYTDPNGYLKGSMLGKVHRAHRVIWFMMTKDWPDEVDHEDGNKTNNRWDNLKDKTKSGNQRNRATMITNTSGTTGVVWDNNAMKWKVSIRASGKQKHLGYFANKDIAITVRKAAEIEHGYHENHGR